MARTGLQGAAADYLSEDRTGERWIDLQIHLTDLNGRTIIRVGGRWDREARDWSPEDAKTEVVWKLQPAQYDLGLFFAKWLRAYGAGERVPGFEDIYSVMIAGGRGGGKSDFGVRACAMFAIAFKDRIVWDVAPVKDEDAEIVRVMDEILRPEWFTWLKSEKTWRFWNGSEIQVLSAHKPEKLKRGRVDFWMFNEGQRFQHQAYLMARPRLGDTSGLGLITCNPPSEPKGKWILDYHDRINAGRIHDMLKFHLDPDLNPFIDRHSFELLRETFGETDYRREILGEFLPVGDVVFYAWSHTEDGEGNIRPAPVLGDITRKVTARVLGREFDVVIGMDFQKLPHMAAMFLKFYGTDPADPLAWFVDECIVEDATEDDLIDSIESLGYEPGRCAIIADASGDWQGSERVQGRFSFDMIKKRGWRYIYPPDRKMRSNPLIIERCAATNARMCNSNGVRKLFSVPELHHWNESAKNYENRNGAPYRKSKYAHVIDAGTYPLWRFFPRKARKSNFEYKRISQTKTKRARQLDGI